MKRQRPVNLDLTTIQFPLTAVVSILHRISGIVTFVTISVLLWLLGLSLSSPEGFLQASAVMDSFIVKFIIWIVLTALACHIVGGIRHMMIDFGFLDETLHTAKFSAQIAFYVTMVLSILFGVFVW